MRLLSLSLLFISLVSAQVGGPSLTAPDNGATDIDETASIVINWSNIINVGYYEYEVDVSTSFSSPIIDGTTGASIYYIPANTLSGSTTYYWRVRGQHTSGPWNGYPTSWSSTHSFTTSFPYSGPKWHVSTGGSNDNDGSEEFPFATIQFGLNSCSEGDTVLVSAGTYTENLFWPETNGIKLLSSGDSSNTIIDGGATSSVIYMNPNNVTIDSSTIINGFKITNGGNVQFGGGLFLSNVGPKLQGLFYYLQFIL